QVRAQPDVLSGRQNVRLRADLLGLAADVSPQDVLQQVRSEERRVGKGGRSRWFPLSTRTKRAATARGTQLVHHTGIGQRVRRSPGGVGTRDYFCVSILRGLVRLFFKQKPAYEVIW